MTGANLGVFMACGIFMMLVMLRLEASRFGAAEYDEPGRSKSGFWTRASWYVIGGTLIAALYVFHPAPADVLLLRIANQQEALSLGLCLAAIGLAQAGLFARLRYGYLRLPPGRAYPGAALNAIGTAVIDEATFRGVVLGTFMAVGFPDGAAIVMAAIIYVLATRLAAPGHHPYMALLAGGIGLACGWATVATGGLGAAIMAHAATSFAFFVFTGHAGEIPAAGMEPEEVASRRNAPAGWMDARRPLIAGRGAEPRGLGVSSRSGYRERYAPRSGRGVGRVTASVAVSGAGAATAHIIGGIRRAAALLRASRRVKTQPGAEPVSQPDGDQPWRP